MKATKKSEYTCSDNVKMIYEGSKTLWRQRITIDVYIVSHKLFKVFEVICFSPQQGVESSRIYISLLAISEKFNPDELEEKIRIRKEYNRRQRRPLEEHTIKDHVIEDLVVQFILPRVNINEKTQNLEENFDVVIIERSRDSLDNLNKAETSVLVDKPDGLIPLQILHNKLTSVEDFHSTLTKFREESKAAKKHNDHALTALYDGQDLGNVIAFKLEHDREMKKKFSPVKLRWIRAITKVINRCFIEKVKVRLLEIEERQNASKVNRRNVFSDRKQFHTLDNSIIEPRPALTGRRNGSVGTFLPGMVKENSKGGSPVNQQLPSLLLDDGGDYQDKNQKNMNVLFKPTALQRSSSRILRRERDFIRREALRQHRSFEPPPLIATSQSSFSSNLALSRVPFSDSNAATSPTMRPKPEDILQSALKSPPSIMSSYRDKSMQAFTSSKLMSIPWLDQEEALTQELARRPVLHASRTSPHIY